ncbi:MAG: hypothetical protein V1793_17780 [Pseudomonadota bacterium]
MARWKAVLMCALCYVSALGFTGCAGLKTAAPPKPEILLQYAVDPASAGAGILDGQSREHRELLVRHLPVFVVENPDRDYNRIGGAMAIRDGRGEDQVTIDPDKPTIYCEAVPFETGRGAYVNLVYRIHFKSIPFSLAPFHIGAGSNVGLLVIVTLNSNREPVLYTTLHTCGCYLGFVPTSVLNREALPRGWNTEELQSIYSETLPGLLDVGPYLSGWARVRILIRADSHRVRDVGIVDIGSLAPIPLAEPGLQPLSSLEALPLAGGGTASFFETRGARKGYVRGSTKVWERLFMSWWALDWRVGEDKRFQPGATGDPVFYTSLKPWDRKASDLRQFPVFLAYWGWNL